MVVLVRRNYLIMDSKALIDTLAVKLGLSTEEVSLISDTFTGIVRDTVSQGDTLSLPGFGSFEPRLRAERISVQPSTGCRLLIPPRVTLAFRPSASLRRRMRDLDNSPRQSDTADNTFEITEEDE